MKKSNVSQDKMLQAVDMRRKGNTYTEISRILEISVDWCKRNLKSIVCNKSISLQVSSAISDLALRPEGVTFNECVGVFIQAGMVSDPKNDNSYYDVFSTIKKKLMRQSKDHLFRRDWMRSELPLTSFKVLSKLNLNISDYIDRCTDDFMNEIYPDRRNDQRLVESVKYELCMQANPKGILQGALKYNAYLESQAEKIADRVKGDEKSILESFSSFIPEADYTGIEVCLF